MVPYEVPCLDTRQTSGKAGVMFGFQPPGLALSMHLEGRLIPKSKIQNSKGRSPSLRKPEWSSDGEVLDARNAKLVKDACGTLLASLSSKATKIRACVRRTPTTTYSNEE